MICLIQFSLQDYLDGILVTFSTAYEFGYVPGKVENWVVIIETSFMNAWNFPYKILGQIINIISLHFPQTLQQLFITNPHMSLYASWKIIENFIIKESRKKIQILRKTNFDKIPQFIPKECLMTKYGGLLEEPLNYFPPKHCCRGNGEHLDNSVYYSMKSLRSCDERGEVKDFHFDHDETKSTHKITLDFEHHNKRHFGMEKIQESIISEISENDEQTMKYNLESKGNCCNCNIF